MCGRDHDYALYLYKFADRVFFLTGKLVEPRQYYLYIYSFRTKVDESTKLMLLAAKTTVSEHIVI